MAKLSSDSPFHNSASGLPHYHPRSPTPSSPSPNSLHDEQQAFLRDERTSTRAAKPRRSRKPLLAGAGVVVLVFLAWNGLFSSGPSIGSTLSGLGASDAGAAAEAVTETLEFTSKLPTVAVVLDETPYVSHKAELLAWMDGRAQPDYPPVSWANQTFMPVNSTASVDFPLRRSPALNVAHLKTPPRHIVLPPDAPKMDEILFMSAAFMGRLPRSLALYEHFLRDRGAPCFVSLPPEDAGAVADGTARRLFDERGLDCDMKASEITDLGWRVLELIKMAVEYRRTLENRDIKWYVYHDDDTLFMDPKAIQRDLAGYDPDEPWFFAGRTEREVKDVELRGIGWGGGGQFISRNLAERMADRFDACIEHITAQAWQPEGGDGRTSVCAAWVRNATLWETITPHPALHQIAMVGDATGFMQSGIRFLSLHHTQDDRLTYSPLYPTGSIDQAVLYARAARYLGGDVMFTRAAFNNGKVLLAHGHSVSVYRQPLTREQMGYAERTMAFWKHKYPMRAPIREGQGKTTYYLSEVRELGQGRADFTYETVAGKRMRVLYVDGEPLPPAAEDGAMLPPSRA